MGGGGQDPQMYPQKKTIVTYMRERAPQKHIFSDLKRHLHIQSMQFPFITYGMALYRNYNDKILTLIEIYEYASERA